MFQNLSLKQLVFLCIFAAIAIPMVVLVGFAVRHGQGVYQREVDKDMFAALDLTVAAVNRRLFIEEDLIRALSQVPAVQGLLPTMLALREVGPGPEFRNKREEATRFFEMFQSVRRSLGTVRIFDLEGDTLIKVRDGARIKPSYENFENVPIVENGSESPEFVAELEGLRPDDVGSIIAPPGFESVDTALQAVVPLRFAKRLVGYLSIASPLIPIDRTLDVSPRPYGGSLLVAEINPDNPDRHGLVLYSDDPKTYFSANPVRRLLSDIEPNLLAEEVATNGHKFIDEDGDVWYLRQYLPYPDRLVGWLFAYRPNQNMSRFSRNWSFPRTELVIARGGNDDETNPTEVHREREGGGSETAPT